MGQTTERFLRMEAIFHEALAAPSDARNSLIASLCAGDGQLASEVSDLLLASEAEAHLTASRRLAAGAGGNRSPGPTRVGPYEVDHLLGRGGMGAVYLAHRADGQFEQQVAIKLIDLPLATEIFRERFRQERQILAELQHPYISRLLDGGVTAEGDLYLVMEYVDGIPIHSFCEKHSLTLSQRITLFLRVCEAVHFAHRHFVVHRDLKPDNILVSSDSTPRLLDFGTAKLVSPSPALPDSKLTREGYQSFTPQYASPEQVLGNPITTASDTYSLGVLLYQLLTGMLPYELKELTTAEMLRVICEEPPRRPREAVGSDARIDADLEAILLKALRKDPGERYLTAEQMSSDLHAYLAGLPVAARRGTLRYRSGKFIRRHRWGIMAASLLLMTAFLGIAGVLWQARVATAERRKAEARSADLRQLSNSLLSELDEAIKQLPGSTGAQKLLVTRVLEHLDRMARDSQGDRQTQLDLVEAYTRLGNIQGNAYDQNLGDPDGALASLGKALSIAEPLAAADPHEHSATRALALVQQSRSEILWQTGKTPGAVAVMREALKSFDRLAADLHATSVQVYEAGSAYGTLGDELGESGTESLADSTGAIAAYRRTLALDERSLQIDPNFQRGHRGLAVTRMKIGTVEMATDPDEALEEFQAAAQSINALPAAEQGSLPIMRVRAMLLRKEGDAFERLGNYAQADPLFREALEIHERIAAQDPKDLRALFDVVIALQDQANSYDDASRPRLAEKSLVQVIANMDRLVKGEPSNDSWNALLAYSQVRIGTIRTQLKMLGATAEFSRKGLAALRVLAGKDHASATVLDQTADAFLRVEPAALKDPRFAVACAEREVAMTHEKTPFRLLTLAQAFRAAGQIDKGKAAANQGLELLPPLPPGKIKPSIRKMLEAEADIGH